MFHGYVSHNQMVTMGLQPYLCHTVMAEASRRRRDAEAEQVAMIERDMAQQAARRSSSTGTSWNDPCGAPVR